MLWTIRYVTIIDNNNNQPNSAIHKAAVQPAAVQNRVWRVFCTAASFDILGIISGKPVERPWTVRPTALWIVL